MAKKGKNAIIKKLHRILNKCDIIVIKKGLYASAPCCKCLSDLKKLGLRRVYYSHNGTMELKMEKISQMVTNHVSSGNRKPWSKYNNNKQKIKI